ncbi:MAG: sulfotransferase family 2 domain-containing protein [Leptolyngbyaceae cyanobacterium]
MSMRTLAREVKNECLVTGYRLMRQAKRIPNRPFDGFIFIHINKTGGSSITKALNLVFEHKTALQKKNQVGLEDWYTSYTFAFVRNPWDKVVSHYHYRLQTNQTGLGINPIDFKDWVQLTYGEQDPQYYDNPMMFMPQTSWITDRKGRLLVDYIGRFEHFNKDFDNICQKIGKIHVTLPHVKPSKRGHYREYYDDLTMNTVGKWFSQDIENFGYTF